MHQPGHDELYASSYDQEPRDPCNGIQHFLPAFTASD